MPETTRKKRVVAAPPLPVHPAFKREFLDFERGIRMGGLEPQERITQIIKYGLVSKHHQDFVIDKWGRGRFWQWICWICRANRDSKPISGGLSFAAAKFYLSLDSEPRQLTAGLQIERARLRPVRGAGPDEVYAAEDWDFYRLVKGLKAGSPIDAELRRLVTREGFTVHVGGLGDDGLTIRGRRWGGAAVIGRACRKIPAEAWGWFQCYYAIPEKELLTMNGSEIVAAVIAIFDEVTPLMNRITAEAYLTEKPRAARPGE
jgi:hypothetical protein